jgi:hypothetical protein
MAFETRLFFGRPGRLAALRSPRGTVAANRQRRISIFELGIGGAAVDQMTGGSRVIIISYEQLTRDDWATLDAFAQGHEGPGPFALLDPGQRNRLPANMAAATSVTSDTDNFSIAGSGCTIASSSTYTDAGPRSLAWTFSNASPGASAALTPDWPSSVFPYGVPAVVGQSATFSAYVRGGGTDAIVTYTPQLIYKDITGAVLSTTSGTPVASSSGAFAQMFVTAVAPASTAYVDWKIAYTSGVSTGSIGYFRRFMLNEGTTPDTTWMPGTGVWPVRFGELPDAWPYLSPELRERPSVALIEDVT